MIEEEKAREEAKKGKPVIIEIEEDELKAEERKIKTFSGRLARYAIKAFNYFLSSINIKFPIQIQTYIKAKYFKLVRNKEGKVIVDEYGNPFTEVKIVSYRIRDISNVSYTANNFTGITPVLEDEIYDLVRQIRHDMETWYDWGEYDPEILNFVIIRFWEFRPMFLIASGFIETPKWLENRRAIINIKNKDNLCFIKCIYRALNYDSKNRHNDRDVRQDLLEDFKKKVNCTHAGEIPNILKFEEDNPNISIDVYYLPSEEDVKQISLMYKSKNVNAEHRIILGYLENEEDYHFVIIRKLSLILYGKNASYGKEEVCQWCLGSFRVRGGHLERHLLKCQQRPEYKRKSGWERVTLPDKRNIISFKKHYLAKSKFVVYADFEAFNHDTKQKPNSYCLFCPDLYDLGVGVGFYFFFHKDPVQLIAQFCKDLDMIHKLAMKFIEQYKNTILMKPEDQEKFDKQTTCEI
jgi:hypothetical protein